MLQTLHVNFCFVRTVAEAPIVEHVKTLKEKKKAFFVGILEFGKKEED